MSRMERIRFTADDPGEDVEIAGIRYQPNNSERAYRIIKAEGSGAALGWATLEPDPRNHYDSFAVEVRAFGRKIGYLPARMARNYQDYTLEAERKNAVIEVPIRLRGRNYRGEFKVLGSLYLPNLSVLAERFPNLVPEDSDDEVIPTWADADRLRREAEMRRTARPRMTQKNLAEPIDDKPQKPGNRGCSILTILVVLLVVLAFVM